MRRSDHQRPCSGEYTAHAAVRRYINGAAQMGSFSSDSLPRVQNLLNTCVASIMWIAVGYGVYAHPGPALFGSESIWFPPLDNEYPSRVLLTALLASTATNLVSGAVAERVDARAYLLIVALMSGIIFPVVARSVWYAEGMQSCMFAHGFALYWSRLSSCWMHALVAQK